MKNKWVAFLLCLFFGVIGAHRFYEGRILLGILYVLTGGLFGIGVIIDLIRLFFKPNPYFP
ncbi:MAG: TM2 domain-containing protein [Clostridia bacterium]|nr:TM2 domain-containing protein [Clostridia bacterium]